VASVAELAAGAGVTASRVVDQRPDGWLGSMYAYYDAHGLPVGVLPLRTLLAEKGAA
jgi:hypothetical protein